MRKRKTPVAKFKVGDQVNTTKNLYGETHGVVTEVRKTYQRCDEHGNIERGGLCSLEEQFYIPEDPALRDKPWVSKGNKDITYEFAGPDMIVGRWHRDGVEINEGPFKRTFYNVFTRYSYTVDSGRMLTIFPERCLSAKP